MSCSALNPFPTYSFKESFNSFEIEATKEEKENIPRDTIEKPVLPPPRQMGLFATCHLLDKLCLATAANSINLSKQELDFVEAETQKIHKNRLEQIQEAIKKEHSVKRWNMFNRVMGWLASMTGIVTGITLIATGVGAVAGSMLIAAGVLSLSTQLMEISGGWNKVADLLPTDNPKEKQAIISWIQIGICVLSVTLGIASAIFGGFSSVKDSMKTMMQVLDGVTIMAQGISCVGIGISSYRYNNDRADVKEHEIRLETLKHIREELVDAIDTCSSSINDFMEYFNQSLSLQRDLARAEQAAWR
ncbi:MAG: hypothetical protein KDK55_00970 [Chlamydiia bacterium]|nr:hypothetical protein [Chlamydiia bacterium]